MGGSVLPPASGILASAVAGLVLGGWYSLCEVPLLLRPSRVGRFFADLFFCLVGGTAWFFFLLAVSAGRVRWYLCLGTFGGFFAWRQTAGRLLRFLLLRLRRPLRGGYRAAKRKIEQMFVNISKFSEKIAAKTHLFFKNLLQRGG